MKIVKTNKNVLNFIEILTSKTVVMLVGFFTAFLLPSILSIEEYSHISMFRILVGYIGIFHFGLVDGVYLRYGKYDYNELPKENIRYLSKYLIYTTSIITGVIISVTYFLDLNYYNSTMLVFLAINIAPLALQSYHRNISLGTRQVRFTSVTPIIQKIIYTGLLFVTIFAPNRYLFSLIAITATNVVTMLFGLVYYRDLTFGKSKSLNKSDMTALYTSGFLLLIANYISTAIIVMDRLFVDAYFDTVDFAMYAFAVSTLGIIDMVVTSINQVLYPSIARMNADSKHKAYKLLTDSLVIISALGISGYFIFEILVDLILPDYTGSLSIMFALLPAMIFRVDTMIAKKTFIYSEGIQKEAVVINIIVLPIGILLNWLACIKFDNPSYIAYATLISFVLWCIFYDILFKIKGYRLNTTKYLYSFTCIGLYILVNNFGFGSITSLLLYGILASFLTIGFYLKLIKQMFALLKS